MVIRKSEEMLKLVLDIRRFQTMVDKLSVTHDRLQTPNLSKQQYITYTTILNAP